jgi:hypothetical protein
MHFTRHRVNREEMTSIRRLSSHLSSQEHNRDRELPQVNYSLQTINLHKIIHSRNQLSLQFRRPKNSNQNFRFDFLCSFLFVIQHMNNKIQKHKQFEKPVFRVVSIPLESFVYI